WDWEGKLVDEAVMERLLGEHLAFFKKHPLGEKVFLTFRVPNPRVESGYRLGRAFMVILSAREAAQGAGLPSSPLFEVILPMTESAGELLRLHQGFERFAKAAEYSFGQKANDARPLEILPLFERVGTLLRSGDILQRYLAGYRRLFKRPLPYLRPFCARSDPALNSGMVATTLAIKWALSEFARFSAETGVPTFPVIAPGSLPFRGGLTPDDVAAFLHEFSGMRTVVIQSAFRYDYPLPDVKRGVRNIIRNAKATKTVLLSEEAGKDIERIILWFEKPYRKAVLEAAPFIQRVAEYIPPRRERMQHIGLFGYSRGVGNLRLPRAIGFTAACYSLGIPPEFFGVGRGIERARKEKELHTVETLYTTLRPSLLRAGGFLRKESLTELGLSGLAKEIALIEEYLGEPLGPKTTNEQCHVALSGKILAALKNGKPPTKEIEQAAILRQALG
ncbi:MAG: phosphoenolpyruvate carboxylase, partial [Patescibacteria group bacterium]